MARTADLALREIRLPPGYDRRYGTIARRRTLAVNRNVQHELKSAQKIVADNVSDYCYTYPDAVPEHFEDYHCVTPPYPVMWVEHKRIARDQHQRTGSLVVDHLENDDRGIIIEQDSLVEGCIADCVEKEGAEPFSVVGISSFIEQGHRVYGPLGWLLVGIDNRGRIMGNRWSVLDLVGRPDMTPDLFVLHSLTPLFMTLSLMHCRNIELDDNQPPERLSLRHKRDYGQPLQPYKTLRLVLPGRTSAGASDWRTGAARAPHIARGHFAHYGACCPTHPEKGKLFGKLTGVYFMPMTFKGSADAILERDIEVIARPPEGTNG